MKPYILALATVAVGACSNESVSAPDGDGRYAMLTIGFESRPADTLHVVLSDSATIARAESYVATHNGPRMISGRIVKGALLDARYPFHFKAGSVQIVDAAIELCDGAPMRTAQDVDNYFEGSTGSASSESAPWCPWSSYPIAVQRISLVY
ncbi:MAG TPA: hypothetical protein VH559_04875 [Gemmatimonadaceae bacterium]|jgi:hypothetical protein